MPNGVTSVSLQKGVPPWQLSVRAAVRGHCSHVGSVRIKAVKKRIKTSKKISFV